MTVLETPTTVSDEIMDFYNKGVEAPRLSKGIGPLEWARGQELLLRYLPPPPAVVFDIGGGPGRYAGWLATLGYDVHLIDIVPLHIEQARAASAAQPAHPLASAEVGDARSVACLDACADVVLLFGPLYHLTEQRDRLRALREAFRILRPGGLLLALGITRYASTLVGLTRWWIADADYRQMMLRELTDGQHRRPESWPNLFTTGYFHHPAELKTELEAAGFTHEATLAVEGAGWIIPDFEAHWQNEADREALLEIVRAMETEAVAVGMSPHVLAVGKK